MITFTFNKKARCAAVIAIKKLETGSFASAVLGSFGANPKLTAISALLMFVLCRVAEIVIAGVEDYEVPGKRATTPRKKAEH